MDKKICFIICSNNKRYLEECLFYLSKLEVPTGYTVEAISIFDAKSMAGGYNEGLKAAEAKYKIYLHQDVFIIYKKFLEAILNIFHSDPLIGMIGVVGTPKISVGGVMWFGHREGQLYGTNPVQEEYAIYNYKLEDGLHEVDAIDGLMMITSIDIPWKEETFDGWDFYDVSQSFEFRKAGYKVVVPEQLCPWCVHDDGVLNLINYDKYRKICMQEYSEYFYPDRFYIGRNNYIKTEKRKTNRDTSIVIIARNQFDAVKKTLETINIFSVLDYQHIIVVDNGSEDGLRHWLRRQKKVNYIICEEAIEGYAAILNEVVKQFITIEDLLIVSAGLLFLPGCMEKLKSVLEERKETGAVCGRKILGNPGDKNSFINTVKNIHKYYGNTERRELTGLPYEGILIKNEMLQKSDGFEERLLLPDKVMLDFAFQGKRNDYSYYEVEDAYFYKVANSIEMYLERFNNEIDEQTLNQKWEKYRK